MGCHSSPQPCTSSLSVSYNRRRAGPCRLSPTLFPAYYHPLYCYLLSQIPHRIFKVIALSYISYSKKQRSGKTYLPHTLSWKSIGLNFEYGHQFPILLLMQPLFYPRVPHASNIMLLLPICSAGVESSESHRQPRPLLFLSAYIYSAFFLSCNEIRMSLVSPSSVFSTLLLDCGYVWLPMHWLFS